MTGTVIVAGGGVVRAGVVPDLRELADRTNIGVLNTWTAKGLFPWDHPAHLGTMGLQAGDIALAGLSDFDDVIMCGVDDELPLAALEAHGVRWRDVAPADLAGLQLPMLDAPTPRPRLYTELSAVCQPMYVDESLPLNPAHVAADLAGALPDNGVVTGDACRSGFWLGRAFPTRALGSVVLPSRAVAGFAATQALLGRRTGRFSVAVVDEIDAATQAVLERATDLVVEVWTDSSEGDTLDPVERVRRLLEAHSAGGVHVLTVPVRFAAIDVLTAVAGAPLWGA